MKFDLNELSFRSLAWLGVILVVLVAVYDVLRETAEPPKALMDAVAGAAGIILLLFLLLILYCMFKLDFLLGAWVIATFALTFYVGLNYAKLGLPWWSWMFVLVFGGGLCSIRFNLLPAKIMHDKIASEFSEFESEAESRGIKFENTEDKLLEYKSYLEFKQEMKKYSRPVDEAAFDKFFGKRKTT